MAPHRSLLAAYKLYLRRLAERGFPGERNAAMRAACGPWLAALAVTCFAIRYAARSLNFSTALFNSLILLTGAICMAGLGYAGATVLKFMGQFSRTPKGDWPKSEAGELLIAALGRSTLDGLWEVTLATRMRTDLKLSASDLSGLLRELSETTRRPSKELAQAVGLDPTVQQLLDAISG